MVDAVSDSKGLFDAVSNLANNPRVATLTIAINSTTDTTNGNSPPKLLANREVPAIIQGVIPPVHQATADGVSTCGRDLHALRTVLSEKIFTGTAPSAEHVFKDPPVVNWKITSRLIRIDMNTIIVSPRATTQVLTSTGTSAPPIRIRIQEIGSPRGSIGPQKVRNAHPFKTLINQFSPEYGHLMPIFRKVIGSKTVPDESADVYVHKRMYFGINSVLSESPNFMDFGLSPANTPDKLESVIIPTTIVVMLKNGSRLGIILRKLRQIN